MVEAGVLKKHRAESIGDRVNSVTWVQFIKEKEGPSVEKADGLFCLTQAIRPLSQERIRLSGKAHIFPSSLTASVPL